MAVNIGLAVKGGGWENDVGLFENKVVGYSELRDGMERKDEQAQRGAP